MQPVFHSWKSPGPIVRARVVLQIKLPNSLEPNFFPVKSVRTYQLWAAHKRDSLSPQPALKAERAARHWQNSIRPLLATPIVTLIVALKCGQTGRISFLLLEDYVYTLLPLRCWSPQSRKRPSWSPKPLTFRELQRYVGVRAPSERASIPSSVWVDSHAKSATPAQSGYRDLVQRGRIWCESRSMSFFFFFVEVFVYMSSCDSDKDIMQQPRLLGREKIVD